MLKIINDLSPFFEDCYREISVREFARENGIAPPTASKMLKYFASKDLLKMHEERSFLLFRTNRESKIMKDLSRIYWQYRLHKLVDYLESNLHSKSIVLFGSLSKLEVKKDSDIDLAVFAVTKEEIKLNKLEKKIGRKIQLFIFDSIDNVNKELRMNIIRGHLLRGIIM